MTSHRSRRSVDTTCPYCGVGCGVTASFGPAGEVSISGDRDHPANFGRLCSKGSALAETLDLEGRLLTPQIDGKRAGWEAATTLVAAKFLQAMSEHGPDSVAFYVSGQLLTEDYYVANKLMKGFIGSANIDTNSRLCMASSVAAHKRAFGTDTVPGTYEDLEQADLVVLVGSNLAWCHPVLYQRIVAAKAKRPGLKVVNIDPRRTATNDVADLHLPLAPGSDVALFNGLLRWIEESRSLDAAFIASHVEGADRAFAEARAWTLDRVAHATGLDGADLAVFFEAWSATDRTVTVYSQGVNQSSSGTDKANAILNCHLATGRIGRPGSAPFSVTGQPNAMGGREVGGLANMLACHLDIQNPDHRARVQAFWNASAIPDKQGLKAVDMFEAVHDGRIRALWIMSTNPVASMPDAARIEAAIANCPFVVVSDIMADTATTAHADVLLPAAAWGEKSGTVTNSDRTISRQRPFRPPPGHAKPDWQIICDVAASMGWKDAFAFDGPAGIFREHARLSGIAGSLGLDFDISGLADMSDGAYEALQPTRWPVSKAKVGGRFFADGMFYTATKKARMLALTPRGFAAQTSSDFPLRLNTGRVRDHWHTMTRTGKSPRLSQHIAEPFAEVHPADADRFDISPVDLMVVEARGHRIIVRALVTDRTPPGTVFVPMHWNAQWAATACVGTVIPSAVDPVSGQPELKGAPVRIMPFKAAWYGFAAGVRRMQLGTDYWSAARTTGGWRAELAHGSLPEDWEAFARELVRAPRGEAITFIDDARGIARVALIEEARVAGVLFAAPDPVEVSRGHVLEVLRQDAVPAGLLAGRPGLDQAEPGAIVCSCFSVGVNTILDAVDRQGLADLKAIGDAIQAGTNCGSCRPELQALLDGRLMHRVAAE